MRKLDRRFVLALGAVAFLGALSACSSSPSTTSGGNGESTRVVGNWEIDCNSQMCLIYLINTLGAGVNNVVIKLDKPSMKVDHFGFVISGDIGPNSDIGEEFANAETLKPFRAHGSMSLF